MTANKFYIPAFIGGKVTGVSLSVQNGGESDITITPYQGLFYVYQGQEYPLIVGNNDPIKAGTTYNLSREIDPQLVPSSDIKLMVSTGDLVDCVIDCNIMWSVE